MAQDKEMMMEKALFKTSKAVLLAKAIYKKHLFYKSRLAQIYKNSMTYKKAKSVFKATSVAFQYSFLGGIAEIGEGDKLSQILENSRFVRWLLGRCGDWRKRIAAYSKKSFTAHCAAGLGNMAYALPVKAASIIVVTAISSNIVFYALLKNVIHIEIGLLGWIMRGMLLFVGLAGLFCEADLANLKSTSLFLHCINSYAQSHSEEK